LPRDGAPDDLVDELEAAPGRQGRHLDLDVAVLPAASGLLDVLALRLGRLPDRLLVGDLRLADADADTELAHQAVGDDLEVQLAHPRDDRLGGVGVGLDLEGGVLLRQLAERGAQLLLVRLRLRLDGPLDERLAQVHRLEDAGPPRAAAPTPRARSPTP